MNGIIKKKVQYIFETVYNASLKTDVPEGTYSLIRSTGDIYIFNGTGWIRYRERVLPDIQTRKIQANRQAQAWRPKISSSYFMGIDCDVFIGQYANSFAHYVNIWQDSQIIGIFNSGSNSFNPMTTSSMWQEVSMSLS